MDNYILLTLEKAKKSNQIVAIHTDPYNQSDCSVGFVVQITDTMVRLKSISPEGQDSGYEVRSLRDIFRVDINGKYENKIDFLKKNYDDIFKEIELVNSIENDDLIFTTLKEAQYKNLIVIIWTEDKDDSVIGYINSLSSTTVKILSIDDYGKEDGFIAIDLNKINDLDCNSLKCQILKFLGLRGRP